jgi:hypothetical protein
MAFEAPGASEFSFEAGADLTESQFHFVALTNTGTIIRATADEAAIGILQNKPNLGEAGTVWMSGISKACTAAGPINIGDAVGTNALGEAIAGGGIGRALTPTTGFTQLATVLFSCLQPIAAGVVALSAPPSGNDQYDKEQEFVDPTSPTRDTGLDTTRPGGRLTAKAEVNAEKDKEKKEKENKVKAEAGRPTKADEPAGLHGDRKDR